MSFFFFTAKAVFGEMDLAEAEGKSEMKFTDIEAPIDSFDASAVFHVVTGVLGFVLYMHQQIPSILEDITLEFETLHMERRELEPILAQTEVKASSRRMHAGKMREVKLGIRRLEKLMKTVSSVQTALQLMISEIPNIQRVLLVLGASSIRPQHVYEMCFSHGGILPGSACNFTKTRAAEGLSRKIVPFRCRFKCRSQRQKIEPSHHDSETADSISMSDSTSNDLIWFQCRHVIKGLPSKNASPEE